MKRKKNSRTSHSNISTLPDNIKRSRFTKDKCLHVDEKQQNENEQFQYPKWDSNLKFNDLLDCDIFFNICEFFEEIKDVLALRLVCQRWNHDLSCSSQQNASPDANQQSCSYFWRYWYHKRWGNPLYLSQWGHFFDTPSMNINWLNLCYRRLHSDKYWRDCICRSVSLCDESHTGGDALSPHVRFSLNNQSDKIHPVHNSIQFWFPTNKKDEYQMPSPSTLIIKNSDQYIVNVQYDSVRVWLSRNGYALWIHCIPLITPIKNGTRFCISEIFKDHLAIVHKIKTECTIQIVNLDSRKVISKTIDCTENCHQSNIENHEPDDVYLIDQHVLIIFSTAPEKEDRYILNCNSYNMIFLNMEVQLDEFKDKGMPNKLNWIKKENIMLSNIVRLQKTIYIFFVSSCGDVIRMNIGCMNDKFEELKFGEQDFKCKGCIFDTKLQHLLMIMYCGTKMMLMLVDMVTLKMMNSFHIEALSMDSLFAFSEDMIATYDHGSLEMYDGITGKQTNYSKVQTYGQHAKLYVDKCITFLQFPGEIYFFKTISHEHRKHRNPKTNSLFIIHSALSRMLGPSVFQVLENKILFNFPTRFLKFYEFGVPGFEKGDIVWKSNGVNNSKYYWPHVVEKVIDEDLLVSRIGNDTNSKHENQMICSLNFGHNFIQPFNDRIIFKVPIGEQGIKSIRESTMTNVKPTSQNDVDEYDSDDESFAIETYRKYQATYRVESKYKSHEFHVAVGNAIHLFHQRIISS